MLSSRRRLLAKNLSLLSLSQGRGTAACFARSPDPMSQTRPSIPPPEGSTLDSAASNYPSFPVGRKLRSSKRESEAGGLVCGDRVTGGISWISYSQIHAASPPPPSSRNYSTVSIAQKRVTTSISSTKSEESNAEAWEGWRPGAGREERELEDYEASRPQIMGEVEVETTKIERISSEPGAETSEILEERLESTERTEFISDSADSSSSLDSSETPYSPMEFQIPARVLTRKLSLKDGNVNKYWNHTLYRNKDKEYVKVHYCTTLNGSERVAKLFENDAVLGFDLEWAPYAKSKSIKKNVSVIQIANESNIALFHLARMSGNSTKTLIAPTLEKLIASQDILKVGVNISGDAKRVKEYLKIIPYGIFELSDFHNMLVHLETGLGPSRRLFSLAKQTEQYLMLPLHKGDVRMSDWTEDLTDKQIHYAAADAYAALRIYDVLQKKRMCLSPMPKLPPCREFHESPPLDDVTSERRPSRTQGPEISESERAAEMKKAEEWVDAFRNAQGGMNCGVACLKAYALWHDMGHSVEEITKICRDPPLKSQTIVNYLLEAICIGKLPYDKKRLEQIGSMAPENTGGQKKKWWWW